MQSGVSDLSLFMFRLSSEIEGKQAIMRWLFVIDYISFDIRDGKQTGNQ
jgi:hypothetical protein